MLKFFCGVYFLIVVVSPRQVIVADNFWHMKNIHKRSTKYITIKLRNQPHFILYLLYITQNTGDNTRGARRFLIFLLG